MESDINNILTLINDLEAAGIRYIPRIIGAFIVYLVGKWLIVRINHFSRTAFEKHRVDPSLATFFSSFIRIALFGLLLLAIIDLVGVPIAGFAAILAGLSFGIGSALNGSLGNVAGGILILLTRPFSIGDLIAVGDKFGIVREIDIIQTAILTAQNEVVYLPNGSLITGVITNYCKMKDLRIDIKIPIEDDADIERACSAAISAMNSRPKVINDPAPDVKVTDFTEEGIMMVLWPHIKIEPYDPSHPTQRMADYYSVYFGVRKLVKIALQKEGISAPSATTNVALQPAPGKQM